MTATLLCNFVWEGLASEMAGVSAVDGQIYKQLDTGESYLHRAGSWQFINLGLSFIKATKSGVITTDANGTYSVSFSTPFSDTNYGVTLECAETGTTQPAIAGWSDKTVNGFVITTRYTRTGNLRADTVVCWLATRDYNP